MLQVAEREVSAMLPKECERTAAAVTKRGRSMCCTEDRKIGKYWRRRGNGVTDL